MSRQLGDPAKRLWAQIDQREPEECWPWIGTVGPEGYGHFGVKRGGKWVYRSASRVTLELTIGPEPELHALHTCDNRLCCNPAHLYWGTPQQNVQDMIDRNRANYVSRERHGMARLTEQDIQAIRASQEPTKTLATRFGISPRHVRKIRSGSTWR